MMVHSAVNKNEHSFQLKEGSRGGIYTIMPILSNRTSKDMKHSISFLTVFTKAYECVILYDTSYIIAFVEWICPVYHTLLVFKGAFFMIHHMKSHLKTR